MLHPLGNGARYNRCIRQAGLLTQAEPHSRKQFGECAESFREGAMSEYELAHVHCFVGRLRLATRRLQLSSPSGLVVTPRHFHHAIFLLCNQIVMLNQMLRFVYLYFQVSLR
jgi:hypothetical protein